MKNNKFMGKMKSMVCVLLCALLSFGAFACTTKGGDDDGVTNLTILVGDNAFGKDILEDQAERFSEIYAEKSYATGKKGVKIKVETSGSAITINESLLSEGYHMIDTGDGYTSVENAASSEWIVNIDDIMTTKIAEDDKTIADKIPENIRYRYYLDVEDESKAGYYGVPNSEAYGGLTYDKDLFDTKGFYLAAPNAEGFAYECTLLGADKVYKFVDSNGEKSVGPDGVPNSEDDGLPSSLYELIALCDYIKFNSVYPFTISGKMDFYINYFTEALYSSLLGFENAKAQKDFKSDSMDIVVGYTEEDLIPGLPGVKKPITENVKIDEAHGYYTSMSVEKYYSFAFMKLMEEQNWYSSASNSPNMGASATQLDFLFGLHETDRAGAAAMLIECSYWVNESRIRENFKDYNVRYGKTHPNREFRWMSLPVNIMTAVDGSDTSADTDIGTTESKKGEPITLNISTGGYLCVNARYKDDAEVMGAIKDWFLFRYSDEELSWSEVQGCYGVMLEYEIKDKHLEGASNYAKSYAKLVASANKVYPYGDSDVYRNNSGKLGKKGGSGSYLFGGGEEGLTPVRDFLLLTSVQSAFETRMFTKSAWDGFFGSSDQVAEAWVYPEGHPKAGKPITYEGSNYTNN